eukprot:scaffold29246_cov66-Phaeocystis_antarctica.AAC.4
MGRVPVTVCARGCGRTQQRLQPCVTEAVTVGRERLLVAAAPRVAVARLPPRLPPSAAAHPLVPLAVR